MPAVRNVVSAMRQAAPRVMPQMPQVAGAPVRRTVASNLLEANKYQMRTAAEPKKMQMILQPPRVPRTLG